MTNETANEDPADAAALAGAMRELLALATASIKAAAIAGAQLAAMAEKRDATSH
jgi:hypothetical protein